MEKGYFAAAWGDVTKSLGWVSKLFRLALLNVIPIFGPLVTCGYLYGWARDISWNVHRPLPDRIFGNEDGNLYKRGFFVLVVTFVFTLIPGICSSILSSMFGAVSYNGSTFAIMTASFLSCVFGLVSLALWFFAMLFDWVGTMRTSLYGTLSAGFQFGKIWSMIRYDFMGLLRIFGMSILLGTIIGFVFSIIVLALIFSGFAFAYIAYDSAATVIAVLVAALVVVVIIVLALFVGCLANALIIRALGYWTRQFDVAQWGGQEDPMPFEARFAAEQAARAQAFAQEQQAQAYQPPVQQPTQE